MKENRKKTKFNIVHKVYWIIFILYISFPILVFLLIVVSIFWYPTFSASPGTRRAIKLLRAMSYHELPISSRLVYSKHYKDIPPFNICFVFKYQEGYYDFSPSEYNYLNQNKNHENEDFINDFNKYIVENEGCSIFASGFDSNKIKLFNEYDYHYQDGRGLKIFINEKDKLIMFEGYLFD